MRINTFLAVTGAAVLALSASLQASTVANPAGMIPAGRIWLGASYHLGGYTITNENLPSLMNRFHGRIGYSPLQYFNFGIDLGVTQMDVDSVTIFSDAADTTGTHYITFQGKYGFSAGLNLRGATPRFFNDMVSVIGAVQAGIFTSENDALEGGAQAYYSGIDIAGVLGLQFRVPKFGFVSAGAKLFYIEGDNKSYNSKVEQAYSNTDNIQGWLALDFVPSFKEGRMKGNPYFSAEITLTPGVNAGGSVPIQGMSFSLSVGWISPRLYGEDFEDIE